MPYIALKTVKFDKTYYAGDKIPDKAIAPDMVLKLMKLGLIQKQEKEREPKKINFEDLWNMVARGIISKEEILELAKKFIEENKSDNDVSAKNDDKSNENSDKVIVNDDINTENNDKSGKDEKPETVSTKKDDV